MEMAVANFISTLKNIPSLRNMPDNTLMAITAIAAILVLLFFMLLVSMITDYVREEHREHKEPDSHKLIADLQKTLISEMRGTAKQNALMIWLTVIFISITVIGMFISVVGPQGIGLFIKNMINSITGAAKGVNLPVVK